MLARAMADGYAYNPDGYRQRAYHEPQVMPRSAMHGSSLRRFTIRQRDGRLVIEEL